jgi:hypothetical protein
VARFVSERDDEISLGHDYVGCEHLLIGLVAEPDGTAGQVLRTLGAEPRLTRHAVAAAPAGYVHLRAHDPAVERIEQVQARLAGGFGRRVGMHASGPARCAPWPCRTGGVSAQS